MKNAMNKIIALLFMILIASTSLVEAACMTSIETQDGTNVPATDFDKIKEVAKQRLISSGQDATDKNIDLVVSSFYQALTNQLNGQSDKETDVTLNAQTAYSNYQKAAGQAATPEQQQKTAKTNELIASGQKSFDNKDYEQALKTFKNALATYMNGLAEDYQDETTTKIKESIAKSFDEIISKNLKVSYFSFTMSLWTRDLIKSDVYELFTNYNNKYGVFIISGEAMKTFGVLTKMENGAATNLLGEILITQATFDGLEKGDKDALLTLRHEQMHSEYRAINGQSTTIEQTLIDELYAYFASFLDVYGVDALNEKSVYYGKEMSWWERVYNVLGQEYLNGVTNNEQKAMLIQKIGIASNIINWMITNPSYGPKLTLDYLKSVKTLDEIIAETTPEMIERNTQGQLKADNYKALHDKFLKFVEVWKKTNVLEEKTQQPISPQTIAGSNIEQKIKIEQPNVPKSVGAASAKAATNEDVFKQELSSLLFEVLPKADYDIISGNYKISEEVLNLLTNEEQGAQLSKKTNKLISPDAAAEINSLRDYIIQLRNDGLDDKEIQQSVSENYLFFRSYPQDIAASKISDQLKENLLSTEMLKKVRINFDLGNYIMNVISDAPKNLLPFLLSPEVLGIVENSITDTKINYLGEYIKAVAFSSLPDHVKEKLLTEEMLKRVDEDFDLQQYIMNVISSGTQDDLKPSLLTEDAFSRLDYFKIKLLYLSISGYYKKGNYKGAKVNFDELNMIISENREQGEKTIYEIIKELGLADKNVLATLEKQGYKFNIEDNGLLTKYTPLLLDLPLKRDVLIAEIRKQLEGKTHVEREGATYMDGTPENRGERISESFEDYADTLSIPNILKVYIMLKNLQNPSLRNQMGLLIIKDLLVVDSELGGTVELDEKGTVSFKEYESPCRDSDCSYTLPDKASAGLFYGFSDFHQHAQYGIEYQKFAGPSLTDLNPVGTNTGFVISYLGDNKFNVDFYTKYRQIVDLGVYEWDTKAVPLLTEKEISEINKAKSDNGVISKELLDQSILSREKTLRDSQPQSVGAAAVGFTDQVNSLRQTLGSLLYDVLPEKDYKTISENDAYEEQVLDYLTSSEQGAVLNQEVNGKITLYAQKKISSLRQSILELRNSQLTDSMIASKLTKDAEVDVATLIQSLKNDNSNMDELSFTAQMLARKGTSAIPALVEELKTDSTTSIYIISALARMGKPAVPALIEALKNNNANVRSSVAVALGHIGDSSAVPALIEALINDNNADVRGSAAEALGQIKDPSAVPDLIKVLVDKEDGIEVSVHVADALGNIKDPSSVPALIEALKANNGKLRDSAAQALVEIGTHAVPSLIEVLKDNGLETQVRISAAISLGNIKDPSAVPALIKVLKDNNGVSRFAAVALGNIKDPSSVPALIKIFSGNKIELKRDAAKTLGNIKDPSAVPTLIGALEYNDRELTYLASEALDNIGTPALPALIDTLKNNNEIIRSSAIIILNKIIRENNLVSEAKKILEDPEIEKALKQQIFSDLSGQQSTSSIFTISDQIFYGFLIEYNDPISIQNAKKLYENGIIPTDYLVKNFDEAKLPLWKKTIDDISSGKLTFNTKNQLQVALMYTDFRNKIDCCFSNPIKYTYETYMSVFNVGDKDSTNQLTGDQQSELVYAGYESYRVFDYLTRLAAQAKKIGKKVLVVPNYSYGRFVIEPIQKEVEKLGNIIIQPARVGSTESHNNEFVLHSAVTDRIFDDKTEEFIAKEQPIIVMLDGSYSYTKEPDAVRYPDAQKAYVNFAITLNDALGVANNPSIMQRTQEHITGLKATEDYQTVEQRLASYSAKSTQPYSVDYWNPAGTDIGVSVGKGDTRNIEREVKSTEAEQIQGPAMIIINSVFNDGYKGVYLPKDVKELGNNKLHASAYFDDTTHIQNVMFKLGPRGVEITDEIYKKIRDKFLEFYYENSPVYITIKDSDILSYSDAVAMRLHKVAYSENPAKSLDKRLTKQGLAISNELKDKLLDIILTQEHVVPTSASNVMESSDYIVESEIEVEAALMKDGYTEPKAEQISSQTPCSNCVNWQAYKQQVAETFGLDAVQLDKVFDYIWAKAGLRYLEESDKQDAKAAYDEAVANGWINTNLEKQIAQYMKDELNKPTEVEVTGEASQVTVGTQQQTPVSSNLEQQITAEKSNPPTEKPQSFFSKFVSGIKNVLSAYWEIVKRPYLIGVGVYTLFKDTFYELPKSLISKDNAQLSMKERLDIKMSQAFMVSEAVSFPGTYLGMYLAKLAGANDYVSTMVGGTAGNYFSAAGSFMLSYLILTRNVPGYSAGQALSDGFRMVRNIFPAAAATYALSNPTVASLMAWGINPTTAQTINMVFYSAMFAGVAKQVSSQEITAQQPTTEQPSVTLAPTTAELSLDELALHDSTERQIQLELQKDKDGAAKVSKLYSTMVGQDEVEEGIVDTTGMDVAIDYVLSTNKEEGAKLREIINGIIPGLSDTLDIIRNKIIDSSAPSPEIKKEVVASVDKESFLSALERRVMHSALVPELNNRLSRDEYLTTSFKKGDTVSIIHADIQKFKQINDQYKHQGGNKVIQAFGTGLDKLVQDFFKPVNTESRNGIIVYVLENGGEIIVVNEVGKAFSIIAKNVDEEKLKQFMQQFAANDNSVFRNNIIESLKSENIVLPRLDVYAGLASSRYDGSGIEKFMTILNYNSLYASKTAQLRDIGGLTEPTKINLDNLATAKNNDASAFVVYDDTNVGEKYVEQITDIGVSNEFEFFGQKIAAKSLGNIFDEFKSATDAGETEKADLLAKQLITESAQQEVDTQKFLYGLSTADEWVQYKLSSGEKISQVDMDLNFYGRVNIQYGSAQADKLKEFLMQTIEKNIGQKGKVFIIGGDELRIIFDSDANAQEIVKNIMKDYNDYVHQNKLLLTNLKLSQQIISQTYPSITASIVKATDELVQMAKDNKKIFFVLSRFNDLTMEEQKVAVKNMLLSADLLDPNNPKFDSFIADNGELTPEKYTLEMQKYNDEAKKQTPPTETYELTMDEYLKNVGDYVKRPTSDLIVEVVNEYQNRQPEAVNPTQPNKISLDSMLTKLDTQQKRTILAYLQENPTERTAVYELPDADVESLFSVNDLNDFVQRQQFSMKNIGNIEGFEKKGFFGRLWGRVTSFIDSLTPSKTLQRRINNFEKEGGRIIESDKIPDNGAGFATVDDAWKSKNHADFMTSQGLKKGDKVIFIKKGLSEGKRIFVLHHELDHMLVGQSESGTWDQDMDRFLTTILFDPKNWPGVATTMVQLPMFMIAPLLVLVNKVAYGLMYKDVNAYTRTFGDKVPINRESRVILNINTGIIVKQLDELIATTTTKQTAQPRSLGAAAAGFTEIPATETSTNQIPAANAQKKGFFGKLLNAYAVVRDSLISTKTLDQRIKDFKAGGGVVYSVPKGELPTGLDRLVSVNDAWANPSNAGFFEKHNIKKGDMAIFIEEGMSEAKTYFILEHELDIVLNSYSKARTAYNDLIRYFFTDIEVVPYFSISINTVWLALNLFMFMPNLFNLSADVAHLTHIGSVGHSLGMFNVYDYSKIQHPLSVTKPFDFGLYGIMPFVVEGQPITQTPAASVSQSNGAAKAEFTETAEFKIKQGSGLEATIEAILESMKNLDESVNIDAVKSLLPPASEILEKYGASGEAGLKQTLEEKLSQSGLKEKIKSMVVEDIISTCLVIDNFGQNGFYVSGFINQQESISTHYPDRLSSYGTFIVYDPKDGKDYAVKIAFTKERLDKLIGLDKSYSDEQWHIDSDKREKLSELIQEEALKNLGTSLPIVVPKIKVLRIGDKDIIFSEYLKDSKSVADLSEKFYGEGLKALLVNEDNLKAIVFFQLLTLFQDDFDAHLGNFLLTSDKLAKIDNEFILGDYYKMPKSIFKASIFKIMPYYLDVQGEKLAERQEYVNKVVEDFRKINLKQIIMQAGYSADESDKIETQLTSTLDNIESELKELSTTKNSDQVIQEKTEIYEPTQDEVTLKYNELKANVLKVLEDLHVDDDVPANRNFLAADMADMILSPETEEIGTNIRGYLSTKGFDEDISSKIITGLGLGNKATVTSNIVQQITIEQSHSQSVGTVPAST